MVERPTAPTALVLGAAAGGGFPQWNCGCHLCRLVRHGDPRVRPATQASVAVSGDGESWLIVGASPDLRQQISANPLLWPRTGGRDSPITGVVLIGGDIDAIAGSSGAAGTAAVHHLCSGRVCSMCLPDNDVFEVLDPALVQRVEVAPMQPV